ncbi:nucleotide sugar dehydrogenase [Sorangium sp. So ce233]|uniref:nucleotide sugar dehydrogenase n=1 Tax=Sorangium sp. So ce233 TaxID=3133290 RepID=UPI003F64228A
MAETHPAAVESLLAKINSREAQVGIIGMGYVGLPLALTFIEKGFRVLGFDVDPEKVTALGEGKSYIKHLDPARVAAASKTGRFEATADFARLNEPDAILICVPTPLTAQREPDMSYVVGSSQKIKERLRKGQLVVLESTTYPGTTDELVKGILEQSGLRMGEDFYLAFSPEREDPGNRDHSTATIPKVVGGVDRASLVLAQALYSQAIARTVAVSSARAAEAAKLTENIFRAINIALVNELKVVYDSMGIDVWEVLDAASTKPFGFMRFNPGPGWGGHCIPLDPFYLAWKAREYGVSTKFIELAGEVNVEMPHYVVNKLQLALNDRGKALKGTKVLLLGVAYKKDIDDPRESPAFEIIELLRRLGAVLSFHDPHVPKLPRMRTWPHLPELSSLPLNEDTLKSHDAVMIVTDHSVVDYDLVLKHAALIVDTRGVYRAENQKVIKA